MTERTGVTFSVVRRLLGNWIGTAGNDTLTGGAIGNNVFEGGAGNDALNGGSGYDTYKFNADFGQSVINNFVADGSTSPRGEIDFGAGVTHDELWFQRSGNDLQVDLLGTNQDLTIGGWYGGNARAQVQSIATADGLKIDAQLQTLVAAMAIRATIADSTQRRPPRCPPTRPCGPPWRRRGISFVEIEPELRNCPGCCLRPF
jgi:Ca2+-binding RTX toxin-like protein